MIDVDRQFPELLRRAEAVVRQAFPLTTRKYVLTADNWRWVNRGDAVRDDLAAQRKAKLHDASITAKLTADFVLKTPGGKLVDSAPGSVVLRVPHVTAHNSYVVDGKELTTVNQLRLRPGLYTRFTVDDNVETFVNTSAAGTYRVLLDRGTGRLQFRVGAGKHFPLYAVLRATGVSDAQMREAWGSAVFDASADPVGYPGELHKLLHALRPYAPVPASDAEAEKLVADFLASKPLDPDVNRITLGAGFGAVTGAALLAASKKCLGLSKGDAKADDPESLAFKSLHSIEDFIPERLTEALPGIVRAISMRLDRDPQIKLAVHPGVFSAPVHSFFTTSEFARYGDQSNPVDMTSGNFLTTTMGEGGIGSMHAVTDAVRLVHPSHVGLLDPIHTPEGKHIGVTGHLTIGAKKTDDNKLALDVVDVRTGRTVTKTVQELDREVLAFPGQYDLSGKTPKPLTAEIKGRRGPELTTFRPAEVRYVLRDAKQLFGVTSNMVPFMANDDGNRVGMADRHIEQAIPLKDPDRPLVQAEFHDGRGYEDAFGAAFLPQSPLDGIVKKVTPDFVEVAGKGGTKRVPLHNRYPLNSSAWMHDTPTVKVGDKVKAGQALAESNFTRGGSLAMGKNLRIAYMPYEGRNFEDGVVISEGAARKLVSEHKHEERLDRDATIKLGLDLLLAHFPDQAALVGDRSRYDASGLIRVGAKVAHGDVLIPAVRQQQLHEDYDYAKLHRALSHTWHDCSVYWTHDHVGTVTDVVKTPGFVKVLVHTEEPAVVGDKLCFAPEHELLTRSGWKPAADVGVDDEVCTLNPTTQEIEYQRPTRVYRYDVVDEPMYDLRSQQVAMRVTLNHRLYVNRRGRVGYELRDARSVMGTRVRFKKDGVWRGTTPPLFLGFPTVPLMRLLGFFLAEGNREKVDYRIVFHQTKPAGRTWFRRLCGVLGLHYVEQDTRFIVYHKALWTWLGATGGKSWQKHIQAEVLNFGAEALGALWEGIMVGDGTLTNSGSEVVITSSPTLRDQLQEVALKCGWSANWKEQDADHPLGTPYGVIAKTGQIVTKRHRIFHVRLVKAKNRPQINHGHVRTQHGQTEAIVTHTGAVHCVEVPNHVLYTRLDGKPHWSGNSMRHGGKGIITTILPDAEMYRGADGAPIDVLFNPTGVPGRVNPGQMFEAAAGKLARKTGRQYVVRNFSGENTLAKVRQELKRAGLDEHGEETVVDPVSGRTYPRTMVGDTHFLKLKHLVEKKFSARGVGGAYSVNEQPTKQEEESAQRIGGLELYSLLSGGAKHFVEDSFRIKGQRNDEYWRALQLGLPLPKPAAPFVADKFNTFLLGAGINLNRHGDKLKALPMTDRQILTMSNGAIREPTAVTATDLKPEKGGLFDPAVTGGVGGTHWAHIELAEPIVNPLMRKPARTLLGWTEAELDGVTSGALGLNAQGDPAPNPDGKLPSGGEAVADRLRKIEVDRELARTTAAAAVTKSAVKLDQLNKARRYLEALKSAGLRADEAYVNRVIPVIPPKFRAIYPLPDGSLNVADPVHGYREVLLVSNALRDLKNMQVDAPHLTRLRGDLSKAVSGLVGLTEPLTREAHFKGFLAQIKGADNKRGFFQSRVLSRPQDLSGRSTVIPDPKLNLDEVGLPEKMGLTLYKPFLVRRLSLLGHTPLEARELVEKADPLAVKALHVEAQERPVLMNRAPSLHKFNMMAFKPRIVPGRAIQVNPLIVSGYNMDFDGDSCHGDTLLCITVIDGKTSAMPHQLLAIKDFPRGELVRDDRIKEYAVPEGTMIRSFVPRLGEFRDCVVTLFSVHPNCEEWEVVTRRGRTLLVSADASLATFEPGDMTVGATHPRDAVGRSVPEVGVVRGGRTTSITGPFGDVALTEPFGWLIGAHLGDGWVSVDPRTGPIDVCLSYGRRGEFIIEPWTEGMRALGLTRPVTDRALPHEFEGKKYVSHRLRIGSAPAARWFHALCSHGAANKHLPVGFDQWPFDVRLGLLAGLLDTDGSVAVSKEGKRICLLTTISERLAGETVRLARSLGVGASCSARKPRKDDRSPYWQVIFAGTSVGALTGLRLRHPIKAAAVAAFNQGEPERGDINDRVPLPPEVKEILIAALSEAGASARPPKRDAALFSRYNDLRRLTGSITRRRACWYVDWAEGRGVRLPEAWTKIVADASVAWDEIVSAKPTGRRVEMYDLTVPDALTFCTADGLTLWDTVGLHVPVTEAARTEALDKLLPSRNLFSPASLRVVPQPTMEMPLGLYLMSKPVGTPRKAASAAAVLKAYRDKQAAVNAAFTVGGKTTCAGQLLINQALPEAQRIDGPMTKAVMSATIEAVAKKSPERATAVINALKDLGAHYVSEVGFSVSLRDLAVDVKKRDAILAEARTKAKKIGFEAASREAVNKMNQLVHGDADNRFVVLSSGSGALAGKAGQVNRMIATPVAVTDHLGRAIPVQIRKSYAEGHDLGSYWATLPGARKGMMDKGLSTADTGYLTKLLVQAGIDNRIVAADCKTTRGVELPLSDGDLVGRVTTQGALLTPAVVQRMKLKHKPEFKVSVRSPLTCAAKGGVCQRCFGLNENGQFYPLGYHVGVLAAQTIGEPSTQLALKTFHTGGALGGKKTEGFARVRELFALPENVKHRRIIAQAAGPVKIEPGKAGGWTVMVGSAAHYVPAELELAVKAGQTVQAGDPLSKGGVLRPQDLLTATGDVGRVREEMMRELHDNFASSGVRIRRRIFETALKPMTDRVRITDAAGHADLHRGDVVSYNRVAEINAQSARKATFEPTLFGVVKVPHLHEDFVGRMMHERLMDTMRDAPALGLTADVGPHGHPVTQLAFGGARHIGIPSGPK